MRDRLIFKLAAVLLLPLLGVALLTGCSWSAESDSVRIRGGDHTEDPHTHP